MSCLTSTMVTAWFSFISLKALDDQQEEMGCKILDELKDNRGLVDYNIAHSLTRDEIDAMRRIIDIVSERIADENIYVKKIKKKKKSKSKIQEDDENVNVDVPILSNEENERSIKEFDDKNVDIGSSQARTLSNGLLIEELESGKSDGKAAVSGKKLKVLYTAKLKEGEQVTDTNIGKALYRFKLCTILTENITVNLNILYTLTHLTTEYILLAGDQQVIEGWNVGLDGAQVQQTLQKL